LLLRAWWRRGESKFVEAVTAHLPSEAEIAAKVVELKQAAEAKEAAKAAATAWDKAFEDLTGQADKLSKLEIKKGYAALFRRDFLEAQIKDIKQALANEVSDYLVQLWAARLAELEAEHREAGATYGEHSKKARRIYQEAAQAATAKLGPRPVFRQ
jgi:hypothetical protein